MQKILIADDIAASRDLICSVLEGAGYQIYEAVDGPDALRKAREERPNVIILDVMMPRMDGFEVLKEIRQDRELADIPVIALTANAMQGERERALNAGFTAYVAKPVSITLLRSEVERLAKASAVPGLGG